MAKRNRKKKKNKDLQNTLQKTKDWATQIPLQTRDELRCSGRDRSSCFISTCGTRRVTGERSEHHL